MGGCKTDDRETVLSFMKDRFIFRPSKQRTPRAERRRNPALQAWPFVVVILTQMAVGSFSVYTLSATRTLVTGESLFSKGQHEAVYLLTLYLDTGNATYLKGFQRAIAVPLAYQTGREALNRKPPDLNLARRAFAEGGIAKEDIPAGLWMLRNFRGFPYLERALAEWKGSDHLVLELKRLGDSLESLHPPTNAIDLRNRVEHIDTETSPRAIVFSRALDDGARMVGRILLFANFSLAGVLAALTIWRVGRVLQQRRLSEDALAWQASHDALTRLPNRRAFEQRLSMATEETENNKPAGWAVLYIDLDQFKVVNDTCGHAAGDALLRQLCLPLQKLLTKDALFARLGGDEFSILLPNIDPAEALASAERLRAAVERFDFTWNGRPFGVTASIGLVHNEYRLVAPENMLTKADMACFMAKEKGRNRVHAHRDEDEEVLARIREMNWVQRIQQALNEHRFCLYAQEIVALTDCDDEGIHLEILVRMRDEAGALVPPSSFIPAAERFGVMKLIDRWVVTRAFQTLVERRKVRDELPITCCAINLSGSSFGDDAFLDFLKQAFDQYDVPPRTICFEVTETAAILNLQAARSFVRDLRGLGCTFALDDFGSGMSSFNYLKELPVDYLKIDGSFVRNLLADRPDRAMVEMISHVGHIMGKRIVAEFVESEALVEALRDIGVDYGQGFGIAPPKPFTSRFVGEATALRRSRTSSQRMIA